VDGAAVVRARSSACLRLSPDACRTVPFLPGQLRLERLSLEQMTRLWPLHSHKSTQPWSSLYSLHGRRMRDRGYEQITAPLRSSTALTPSFCRRLSPAAAIAGGWDPLARCAARRFCACWCRPALAAPPQRTACAQSAAVTWLMYRIGHDHVSILNDVLGPVMRGPSSSTPPALSTGTLARPAGR